MPDSKTKGLYGKYRVERNDGKGITLGCIVLEFDDPNAWPALLTWADTVEAEGYVQLAADVRERVLAIQHAYEKTDGDLMAEAERDGLTPAETPGGHLLSEITWDVVADFQCVWCKRVFEDADQAEENPCDVSPVRAGDGGS